MKQGSILSSLSFKFIERLSVKGLGLIISVILARLLSPTEFGEIAIIMVFINLCQTFVQSGLNTALIQSKDLKKEDYSTVFYISVAVAALMVAILWICAPWIGIYYQNPNLVLPLRVYSFSLLFAALNSVQVAKLSREMAFKEIFLCSLISSVLSGALGVTLAFCGAGIWALIVYYFAATIVTCVTMLFATKWIPQLCFSIQRARTLFSYGWKMLASAVLCSLYADIRTLIIGKQFSEADLGYYSRGQQFPDILSNTLDVSIQSVMFPALARRQDNTEAVKIMLRKTVTLGCLLIIPVMAGLAVAAKPFITFLLTEKWLPCVPFMQILCIAYASVPLSSSYLVAIKAIGRSDTYMILEIIRRTVMLSILLITVFVFQTVEAIAWGYAISLWIDAIIVAIPTYRLLGYRFSEQLADLWRPLVTSLLMGGVLIPLTLLPIPNVLILIIQVVAGILVYLGLNILLKNPALKDIFVILGKLKKKKA